MITFAKRSLKTVGGGGSGFASGTITPENDGSGGAIYLSEWFATLNESPPMGSLTGGTFPDGVTIEAMLSGGGAATLYLLFPNIAIAEDYTIGGVLQPVAFTVGGQVIGLPVVSFSDLGGPYIGIYQNETELFNLTIGVTTTWSFAGPGA